MVGEPIIKLGIVQHACSIDRQENFERSKSGIEVCAKEGAKLIVLSELHLTPYFCQTENVENFSLAESFPADSEVAFGEIARTLQVVLVISLFEKRAPGLYHNTAVVIERDGRVAGRYRKMHIPDDPAYYEKFYFTPGDNPYQPISTSVGQLGVMVCWDQWYPEAARLMTLSGAEILIYPTAIGYEVQDSAEEKQRQLDAWLLVQRGHAVANGLPLVAVNRTGFEADPSGHTSGIQFWGNSFVAGPQGELLYQAPQDENICKVMDIDRRRTEEVRRIWPFLRDRRIETYGGLTKRYLD